jgi:hypothetical protein
VAKQFLMSWEPAPSFRWVKMFRGVRYRISADELNCPRTKEASAGAANAWWDLKKAQLLLATPPKEYRDAAEQQANERNGEVFESACRELDEDGRLELVQTVARVQVRGKSAEDAALVVRALQNAKRPAGVPRGVLTMDEAIDKFLAAKSVNQAPGTHDYLRRTMSFVRTWWGQTAAKAITSEHVKEAWGNIAAMPVGANKKLIRWKQVKSFVQFLYTSEVLAVLPRALGDKTLTFKVPHHKVRQFEDDEVKSALAGLSDKHKLWALLALNFGMIPVDMGGLTKDMITHHKTAGWLLTRRRVKTGHLDSVPDVSYSIWPETLALLNQFKSNHPSFWFLSRFGTPLVENKYRADGKCQLKNNISKEFSSISGSPIMLKSFRNIAATKIKALGGTHELVEHFLGEAPSSIAEKHYSPTSAASVQFFKLLEQLRETFLA